MSILIEKYEYNFKNALGCFILFGRVFVSDTFPISILNFINIPKGIDKSKKYKILLKRKARGYLNDSKS